MIRNEQRDSNLHKYIVHSVVLISCTNLEGDEYRRMLYYLSKKRIKDGE